MLTNTYPVTEARRCISNLLADGRSASLSEIVNVFRRRYPRLCRNHYKWRYTLFRTLYEMQECGEVVDRGRGRWGLPSPGRVIANPLVRKRPVQERERLVGWPPRSRCGVVSGGLPSLGKRR